MFVFDKYGTVMVEMTEYEFLQMAKTEYKNFVLDGKKGHMSVHNNDAVNHPSHYETGKFECIDVMLEVFGKEKVMAFCQCNAFKYLYRMDRKNGIEDIEKARWYINKYQELTED